MQSLINAYARYSFRKKIAATQTCNAPLRLNIGAGGTEYPGWISAEKREFDIVATPSFSRFFGEYKIRNILAEHVIEHIRRDEFQLFLIKIRPFLHKNATIRIAVPDASHPSRYVRDLTKPGGLEAGANDHKEFYNIGMMELIAQQAGYRLKPVEYFDSNGFFHYIEQNWENGYISRSFKNYRGRFTSDKNEYNMMIETVPINLRKQFFQLNMSYTSLIADFLV
jgi:predicted SAM-dependent methyltransferase